MNLERTFPARYAKLVRYAKDHCQEAGIPFIDIQQEPAVRDEKLTLFSDLAHLNERGQVLEADVLVGCEVFSHVLHLQWLS